MDSFISVIIATRNRAGLLARTLESLAAQQWPRDRFEIVVADNGSTDDTRSVVDGAAARADYPSVVYLFVSEPGKSHAVNAALVRACGDLFAFTDDDVRPEPDWLDRLSGAMKETGADFAAGRILPIWEAAPPSWISASLYGVLAVPDNGLRRIELVSGGSEAVVPIGANMAVMRRVVDRIGGLHVNLGKLEGTLRTGEDHEFFLRMLEAGFRGVYEPTAVVHHWVPVERLHRQYFRKWLYQNGRDVARLEAIYRSRIRRAWGIPRYLWKQGALDIGRTIRATLSGAASCRFAASTRVLWLAGYVRESWFCRPLGRRNMQRAIGRVSHAG